MCYLCFFPNIFTTFDIYVLKLKAKISVLPEPPENDDSVNETSTTRGRQNFRAGLVDGRSPPSTPLKDNYHYRYKRVIFIRNNMILK